MFARVLTELVSKMKDMQMDKTELGCLRAIVLFNPGEDLSCPTSTLRTKSPGVSFIKLSVDFILKVYVRTKARFCVQQNLRKKPFINPSQGKIVHLHQFQILPLFFNSNTVVFLIMFWRCLYTTSTRPCSTVQWVVQ